MKTSQKIILLVLIVLAVQVCTVKKNTETNRRSPFQQVDVSFTNLNLEAEKGKTLQFESGTTIIIPQNAFVDKNGQPVKGEVQVNYREFHKVAEIIASGITMRYDSAGKTYNFESAGMFEIKANQKGEPVFMASGKKIDIHLASYKAGNFNFYFLQENKVAPLSLEGNLMPILLAQNSISNRQDTWQLLQTSTKPTLNEERAKKLDSLEKLLPEEPVQPKAFDSKSFAFDFELNVTDFPELKDFEGIIWQYAGDPNLDTSNPETNEWIFSQEWSSIQLKEFQPEKMLYRLLLSNQQKSFETIITPALKGNALKKAQALFEKKMANYKKTLELESERIAAIKAEKAFQQRKANFIRSFQIQQLGIYNWDIVMPNEDMFQITANWTLDNQPLEEKATFYLITPRGVVMYEKNQDNQVKNFRFNTQNQNKLIAVLPNDKVGIISTQDFAKNQNLKSGETYTLNLKSVPQKISSVDGLNRLIESM